MSVYMQIVHCDTQTLKRMQIAIDELYALSIPRQPVCAR